MNDETYTIHDQKFINDLKEFVRQRRKDLDTSEFRLDNITDVDEEKIRVSWLIYLLNQNLSENNEEIRLGVDRDRLGFTYHTVRFNCSFNGLNLDV